MKPVHIRHELNTGTICGLCIPKEGETKVEGGSISLFLFENKKSFVDGLPLCGDCLAIYKRENGDIGKDKEIKAKKKKGSEKQKEIIKKILAPPIVPELPLVHIEDPGFTQEPNEED